MSDEIEDVTLGRVLSMMSAHGVKRIYAKLLAANDNSKNQPYFGGDFAVLNILPASTPIPSAGSHSQAIFKAQLDFWWLDHQGRAFSAPNAKLIHRIILLVHEGRNGPPPSPEARNCSRIAPIATPTRPPHPPRVGGAAELLVAGVVHVAAKP